MVLGGHTLSERVGEEKSATGASEPACQSSLRLRVGKKGGRGKISPGICKHRPVFIRVMVQFYTTSLIKEFLVQEMEIDTSSSS